MKVYKTYKFRMYPMPFHQEKLDLFFKASRFTYNYFLEEKEKNPKLTLWEMKKKLTKFVEDYPWLKEVDGCILRTALDDLFKSYKRNCNKLSQKPRLKRNNERLTYRTPCLRGLYNDRLYQTIRVDLFLNQIKIPKLDLIQIKGYKRLSEFPDDIISATVIKEAGKYYVSLLVKEEITKDSSLLNHAVGIDLGVKDLVTTSDGYKFKKLFELNKLENKLKGLNKWLARSQEGSKNRQKIIIKIQRVNQKMRNMRKFYNHMITNQLIQENDIIVLEDLKVKSMIMNGKNKIAKYIASANFTQITNQLTYKTKWYNKKLIIINTYYPSSQICSICKNVNKKLKDFSIREWECPICHTFHDRDINASLNILEEGVRLYKKESKDINYQK